MKFGSGGGTTRKALVVFQFALSLLIIIGTLAVHWQIRFLQQKELGMEKDQVITFSLQGVAPAQYDVMKQRVVAAARHHAGGPGQSESGAHY